VVASFPLTILLLLNVIIKTNRLFPLIVIRHFEMLKFFALKLLFNISTRC
jgi:hypothetical protein